MKIIAVDDEQLMLDALVDSIREAAPEAELNAFRRGSDALAYAEQNRIGVAFLDIQLRGMSGLELGKKLLQIHPGLNIIFCTSYDEYISEAFREVRCNGYITKPVDAEQIATELAHLRIPLEKSAIQPNHRVFFRCIGRFEVFLEGKPMHFSGNRTKELLAYLVNAGGGVCSNQEIIAVMWDDDNDHNSYFKKLRNDLLSTLEENNCGEIILRERGGLAIDAAKVGCDYYDWLKKYGKGHPEEYMTQYSWANIPQFEW